MKRIVLLGIMASLGMLGACGSQGPQGPTGPAGSDGMNGANGANGEAGAPGPSAVANPSISGITPDRTFLARSGEITISGYGTNWSGTTKVDMGTGIKVDKIIVASPTALVVDFTVDKTAATGARDIKVTDGTTTDTYKGAFQVLSPVTVTFQGVVAQGSLFNMTIKVIDSSTPLDATADPNTGAYTNLALTLPSGVTVQDFNSTSTAGHTASAFEASLLVSVDVGATSGKADLDLVSGPAGVTTDDDFPAPAAFNIAARTPTALTDGTASTGNTTSAFDSALYSFTPGAASTLLDWTATSTASGVAPAVALLPASGLFADLIAYGAPQTSLTSAAKAVYAVYWDNTGATGPYSLTVKSTAVGATGALSASNAATTSALAASALPFVATGGDVTATANGEWVKVVSTTANKSLHLQTIGDPNTDTAITVYQSDGTTTVGTQIDTGGLADGNVTLGAAGTYYVVFAQGTANFLATGTTFTGIIR